MLLLWIVIDLFTHVFDVPILGLCLNKLLLLLFGVLPSILYYYMTLCNVFPAFYWQIQPSNQYISNNLTVTPVSPVAVTTPLPVSPACTSVSEYHPSTPSPRSSPSLQPHALSSSAPTSCSPAQPHERQVSAAIPHQLKSKASAAGNFKKAARILAVSMFTVEERKQSTLTGGKGKNKQDPERMLLICG